MRTLPIFVVSLLLLSEILVAQDFVVRDAATKKNLIDSITFYALEHQNGYQMLKELCALGTRVSGSKSSYESIVWAKKKMEDLGFDKVWLQPVKVPRWERGNIESCILRSKPLKVKESLHVGALGGSIAANNITGKVIEVSSFEELQSRANDVAGKIVFFNIPFDQKTSVTFSSYGKLGKYRYLGAAEAARYGAIAVLIRSLPSRLDTVPHVGVMGYRDSIKQIPAAAVSTIDANRLSEILKRDPEAEVLFNQNCRNLSDTLSYNVIGEMTGTDTSLGILVSSGHIDAWDKGTGAHDDGAGCMHAIESVILFKQLGLKPRHTLRTVLFMNEENGSRGAEAYAKSIDSDKQKHVAAIESDRGGFTPLGFTVDKDSASIQRMQSLLPLMENCNIFYIKKGGAGVDVGRMKNVPYLIGFVPDSQRYFDVHHSGNDIIDAVNPRELELGSAAISSLLYLLDTCL